MATTTGPAIPANAMTPAAWDTLNSDYATAYQNALKGGQTDATWAKSPEFLGFQNRTLEGVGNTYDTSKLQSDIASMSGEFDNPIYGDNFRKIVGAEQNRLGFLNGQNSIPAPAPVPTPMPSMQNYSQSSAPAYGNPLIAALRANSPAPARQASGIKDISTGVIFNTPETDYVYTPSGTGGTTGTTGTGTTGTGTTGTGTAGTGTTGTGTAGGIKAPPPPPANNWINDLNIPAPYVSPGLKNKTYQTDWDSLNATYADDFTKAKESGVTEADWVNSPRFKAYQTEVINRAANTFDTDKLASDIALMEQGFNDPIYGDNFRKIVAAEKARLEYLTNNRIGGPGQGQPEYEADVN
jgi:hypothetical protein